MTKSRLWVLGASDPEMEIIERLLRELGESVVYATDESGRRVHPGNAYRCPAPAVPEGVTVYAVECFDVLPPGWKRIDHHRPGDPGYGRPPAEFMAASSIGQVIAELARLDLWPPPGDGCGRDWTPTNCRPMWFGESYEDPHGVGGWWIAGEDSGGCCHRLPYALVPHDLVFAAAADHCLAAAYRGECPGVDPYDLMRWRVETRATHQGRSVEELLADVERAREALSEAPLVAPLMCKYHGATSFEAECGSCASSVVHDLRGHSVPELPEAAARDGVAYLATVVERDGRRKVVLGGHATPECVRAFMTEWAPAQGLMDIYGDPARGFAGAYVEEAE